MSDNNVNDEMDAMQLNDELSEKQLKKLAKKNEKEAKKEAKRLALLKASERQVVLVEDYNTAQFGDYQMIQSRPVSNRQWTLIRDLTTSLKDNAVWVRARVHTVRGKGSRVFVVLRQQTATVQLIASADDNTPRELVKYMSKIPPESIVDVYGNVSMVPNPVTGVSQKDVEIVINKVFVVSLSSVPLPIQLEDASRSLPEDIGADSEAIDTSNQDKEDVIGPTVSRFIRLNNRWIDLRTTANHAIFCIQSAVGRYFRQFFIDRNFIEVHTPKIISAASEGGANVFQLEYFGRPAFLAQSPQLYKQMCINGDLSKVFEIGPVFRSEDSNTHRHLCEFVGLDFEMEIKEHYNEVMQTLGSLFKFIFDNIASHHQVELEAIRAQYPFEPLLYPDEPIIIHFVDAITMLQQDGDTEADPMMDFTTPQEKRLGVLVRQKYNSDFYIVDRYPMNARPFYTMPCPDDPTVSNSYDVMLRGEEITSGAQRVHDYDTLVASAKANDPPIDLETIRSYLDSFKFGSYPHGGAGIGLERVVMLYLGLKNIRLSSMFPRDPSRVTP